MILKAPPYFYPPHPVGAHITVVTTAEAGQHHAALEVEVNIISYSRVTLLIIAIRGGEESGVQGEQGQGELPQEGELRPRGQVQGDPGFSSKTLKANLDVFTGGWVSVQNQPKWLFEARLQVTSPGVGGEQGAGDAAQLHHRPQSPQVLQVKRTWLSEYISLRNQLFQGRLLHCGGGEEAEEVKDIWRA